MPSHALFAPVRHNFLSLLSISREMLIIVIVKLQNDLLEAALAAVLDFPEPSFREMNKTALLFPWV